MKRLSIVTHLLLVGSLLVAASSLGGCALQSSGGDGQSADAPGTDDLTNGAADDPTVVRSGNSGNLGVQSSRGVSLPTELPITEDDGKSGPQPEPWVPMLSIRSAGESSGDNHK